MLIYTPDAIRHYKIFAAYPYDSRHLLRSFDFTDKEVYQQYLYRIFAIRDMNASIDTTAQVGTDDKILTLSTCYAKPAGYEVSCSGSVGFHRTIRQKENHLSEKGRVNNMKKKIMGVILAATLIVSQAVTAFAGSKTSEVVLPNDFAAYYTVTEGTREAFAEAEAVSPQTVDAIIEVNNGSMTLAQLVADMKELLKAEGAAGLKMTEEQVDALAADLGSERLSQSFLTLSL